MLGKPRGEVLRTPGFLTAGRNPGVRSTSPLGLTASPPSPRRFAVVIIGLRLSRKRRNSHTSPTPVPTSAPGRPSRSAPEPLRGRGAISSTGPGDRRLSTSGPAMSSARGTTTRSRPASRHNPSPIALDTTGVPHASASRIFSREPPPIRSGTVITPHSARYGRTSATFACHCTCAPSRALADLPEDCDRQCPVERWGVAAVPRGKCGRAINAPHPGWAANPARRNSMRLASRRGVTASK